MTKEGHTTADLKLSRKEQRAVCWAARDLHYACMDEHGDDSEKCAATKEEYESKCSAVWVQHFNGMRKQKKKQKRLQELTEMSQKRQ